MLMPVVPSFQTRNIWHLDDHERACVWLVHHIVMIHGYAFEDFVLSVAEARFHKIAL